MISGTFSSYVEGTLSSISLIATISPVSFAKALKTSPKLPLPIFSRISYWLSLSINYSLNGILKGFMEEKGL